MENAESVFLKYSFPCAQVLLDKGQISKEEYEKLKGAAISGGSVERETLERMFTAAIRRLKAVFGKDYWTPESVREYFISHHNHFIDEGEGEYARAPGYFKRMCKVHKAKVISRKGNALTVEFDGQTKPVVGLLLKDAKPGDTVTVHLGFAIEKI